MNTVFEDKTGMIWIGTVNGPCYYNRKVNKIKHYIKGTNVENGLSSNSISCVAEKNNRLWIGEKGITTINLSTDEYNHFEWQPDKMNQIIYNNVVNTICPVDDGYAFVGGVALYRINFEKGTYEYALPDKGDPKSLSSWIIWKIHKGQKTGNIWIATQEGLNLLENIKDYSPGQKGMLKMQASFRRFYHDENNNNSIAANLVWDIYEDRNGLVWIGTDNGLSCYDSKNDSFKNYTTLPVIKEEKITIVVKTFFEDHTGQLWIGTEGLGLLKFNNKKKQLEIADITNEVKINNVCGITEDDQYNLWFSTTSGIVRFHPNSGKYRLYDQDDGFLDRGFNYNDICKGEDGRIYVGGVNGLNAFYPKELKDDSHLPEVLITGFNIFNKPVSVGQKIEGEIILSKNIINTKEIVLSYKLKVFSLEFVGLHYYSPSKNLYKYKLEGFDKDWNLTTADKRLITYTNLSPGKYVFRVKASNCDNVWNPKETILKIEILPPFWQTWWFRIFALLFAALAAFAFFMWRTYTIRQQNKMLEKQVKDRTKQLEIKSEELFTSNQELLKLNSTKDKLFSIIAHDLKNPFQAILGISDLYLKRHLELSDDEKVEFVRNINESSVQTYKLLENLLEWARAQSGHIVYNPKNILLSEVVNETAALLKLNADAKKISIINNVNNDIRLTTDEKMLLTVIRNIVNNAIKFTPDEGSITVDAIRQTDTIEIIISDTGVGMVQEKIDKLFVIDKSNSTIGTAGEKGTGLGLLICKEFIGKNNGSIHVESAVGNGTSFIISLPYVPELSNSIQPLPVIKNIDLDSNTASGIHEDEPESVVGSETDASDNVKKIILIVEDNPGIRMNIRQGLPERYEAAEAQNGKEGLAMAFQLIPDLIISDVMMPEMDGFQLCRQLKTDERTSHIPVILLTARTSDNSRMKGLDTGADDYITKPFKHELLNVRIKNLIKIRQQLRERFAREVYVEPRDIVITSTDEKFIIKAINEVEDNIGNANYNVHDFARNMAMSRTLLHNKLKAITDQSATEFIKTIRLKRAAKLLSAGSNNIAEISLMVGFNNRTYFTKCFVSQFGCTPSEYGSNNSSGKYIS